jgi:biotin carboxylase
MLKYVGTKSLDGVVGFNDTGSILASLVAQKLSLPGPTPKAVYQAQNKAIFLTILKQAGLPVPPTKIISLDKPHPLSSFPYPIFIRPIKGITSMHSYQIWDTVQWNKTITALRRVRLNSTVYEEFFTMFDSSYVPLARWFIVQPYTHAAQYTVDGFVEKHNVTLLGVTQTYYNEAKTSFERFDYPASVSPKVKKNLHAIVTGITNALGYSGGGFNIEFFLDQNTNISIIEFNTRISNQFIPLLAQHYHMSPFQMMIELSIGKTPDISKKKIQPLTSSFALRIPHDATVLYRPSENQLEAFIQEYGLLGLTIFADVGKKLSDYRQDAYSFRYGLIDVAGKTRKEILKKFETARSKIPIVLDPPIVSG